MLDKYREKRDFEKTAEPEPAGPQEGSLGPLRFVVQKHSARRLHWDLRLELDGVLVSWAVPKGPSLNPADKHLAVKVEDHPLGYASFEGTIPKGEYGGGEVIVWDEGTYSPDEDGKLSFDDREEAQRRMRKELEKGKVSVTFRGHRMVGSWTLVRTRSKKGDEWLLIKHKDEFASESVDLTQQEESVVSGLTNQDLAEGKVPEELAPDALEGARKGRLPKAMRPMLLVERDDPFSSPDWTFEIKLDGIRVLASVRAGEVAIWTRNGRDVTFKFPTIVEELARQGRDLVYDAEIVFFEEDGVPSFHHLMEEFQTSTPTKSDQVVMCVFDVLEMEGWDLRGVALRARRRLLERTVRPDRHLRLLDAYEAEGELLYQEALKHGFEGIVAKRLDSRYQDGVRTANWVKIKGKHTEDFLVAGYIEGEGSRSSHFGSLILASPGEDGLEYAGNVGTGFNDRTLEEVHAAIRPLETDRSPFQERPKILGKVHWLKPELWVEVKYMRRTPENKLRMPVFVRMRPDKGDEPVSVVEKEEMAAQPAPKAQEANLAEVFRQAGEENIKVKVEGHELWFTSLDKELWPPHDGRPGIKKRDVLAYYAEVGWAILPHLRDRPLTLVRFPNGIEGERFFQKHYEHKIPEFVKTVDIWSESNKKPGEYMVCNNLATLLWLGQIATLEIHPWYSRIEPEPDAISKSVDFATDEDHLDASVLDLPDFMVFDLDPYIYSGKEGQGEEPELNQEAFKATVEVAHRLKEFTDSIGLKVFLKASGKTGLHIYIPLVRNVGFAESRGLAETFGRELMKAMPGKITMDWSVAKRTGKVFFDHNQNVRGKTLVSVYSPRPSSGAPVSFPVSWEELDKIYPPEFNISTVPEELAKRGDAWAQILQNKNDLRKLLGRG